jgi:hypothetical protein
MAPRGMARGRLVSSAALMVTTMLVIACGNTATTASTSSASSPTPTEISSTSPPQNIATEPIGTPWLYDPNASSAPPPLPEAPPTAAPTTLPVNLAYFGRLTGTMSQAINPHSDGNSDPGSFANPQGVTHQPTWTRCSTYVGSPDNLGNTRSFWEADIVGDVGGSHAALAIAIDTSQTHLPGTVLIKGRLSNPVAVLLFGPSGSQWFSRQGQYDDAQITVNPDMHSGQISVSVADVDWGHDDHVERITGGWRCA